MFTSKHKRKGDKKQLFKALKQKAKKPKAYWFINLHTQNPPFHRLSSLNYQEVVLAFNVSID